MSPGKKALVALNVVATLTLGLAVAGCGTNTGQPPIDSASAPALSTTTPAPNRDELALADLQLVNEAYSIDDFPAFREQADGLCADTPEGGVAKVEDFIDYLWKNNEPRDAARKIAPVLIGFRHYCPEYLPNPGEDFVDTLARIELSGLVGVTYPDASFTGWRDSIEKMCARLAVAADKGASVEKILQGLFQEAASISDAKIATGSVQIGMRYYCPEVLPEGSE
jgi:hypothetical protein